MSQDKDYSLLDFIRYQEEEFNKKIEKKESDIRILEYDIKSFRKIIWGLAILVCVLLFALFFRVLEIGRLRDGIHNYIEQMNMSAGVFLEECTEYKGEVFEMYNVDGIFEDYERICQELLDLVE